MSAQEFSLNKIYKTVNGEQLERVDEYKYLGMIFEKNLNWQNHIDKMCAKISQQLGLLQRIKFCIPNLTLRMLYNTLVLPLFDYGNIIYRTTDQTYLKQLDSTKQGYPYAFKLSLQV